MSDMTIDNDHKIEDHKDGLICNFANKFIGGGAMNTGSV